MARKKIPIKITGRVTTRVRGQVRVQHRTQTRTTRNAWLAAWEGPAHGHVTNYFDESTTISGQGHQVAIGVQGSVSQISGPSPIDPDRFAAASRQLLDVLDQLPASDEEREALEADAKEVLAAVEDDEPNQGRLRALGSSMLEVLGRIGTAAAGGTLAQLLGRAIVDAVG